MDEFELGGVVYVWVVLGRWYCRRLSRGKMKAGLYARVNGSMNKEVCLLSDWIE